MPIYYVCLLGTGGQLESQLPRSFREASANSAAAVPEIQMGVKLAFYASYLVSNVSLLHL